MINVGDLVIFSRSLNKFIIHDRILYSRYSPIAVVESKRENEYTKELVYYVKIITGEKQNLSSGPHYIDEIKKISLEDIKVI